MDIIIGRYFARKMKARGPSKDGCDGRYSFTVGKQTIVFSDADTEDIDTLTLERRKYLYTWGRRISDAQWNELPIRVQANLNYLFREGVPK